MKIIKLGIISLVVFALLITGMSLFFPSNIRISKATDIRTEKAKVLSLISDTSNWKQWYPGADSVKLNVEIITSTDSLVVAESNVAGERRATSGWNVFDGGVPGVVTVQWYMDFKLRWYPWEKFSGLLLEKRYGPVMEKGLENMKKVLTPK